MKTPRAPEGRRYPSPGVVRDEEVGDGVRVGVGVGLGVGVRVRVRVSCRVT